MEEELLYVKFVLTSSNKVLLSLLLLYLPQMETLDISSENIICICVKEQINFQSICI